jgi:hypothetical protein
VLSVSERVFERANDRVLSVSERVFERANDRVRG